MQIASILNYFSHTFMHTHPHTHTQRALFKNHFRIFIQLFLLGTKRFIDTRDTNCVCRNWQTKPFGRSVSSFKFEYQRSKLSVF